MNFDMDTLYELSTDVVVKLPTCCDNRLNTMESFDGYEYCSACGSILRLCYISGYTRQKLSLMPMELCYARLHSGTMDVVCKNKPRKYPVSNAPTYKLYKSYVPIDWRANVHHKKVQKLCNLYIAFDKKHVVLNVKRFPFKKIINYIFSGKKFYIQDSSNPECVSATKIMEMLDAM